MKVSHTEREVLQLVIDDLLLVNQNSLSGDDLYHMRIAIRNLKDLRDGVHAEWEWVDVTDQIEPRVGYSGWDYDDKPIYHIQLLHNGDVIANMDSTGITLLSQEEYRLIEDVEVFGEDFRIEVKHYK